MNVVGACLKALKDIKLVGNPFNAVLKAEHNLKIEWWYIVIKD